MVLVPNFTPEALISAPQRGPAVPNHDGTLAIFSQSTHTIGGETLKEIRILNIATGDSEQLLKDEKASSVLWLGDGTNKVVYLSSGGAGFTWVMMVDADYPSGEPYIVDFVRAPINSLKVKPLRDGSIAFVVVSLVDENGELYNEESNKTTHTARVTESYLPRIGDSYAKPQRYGIWYTTLSLEDGKWKLNKPLRNAVVGTNLEAPFGMFVPGNESNDFDVSDKGIVFTASEHGAQDRSGAAFSDVYYLTLDSFTEASAQGLKQIELRPEGTKGCCSHPRFSPDGSMIAFQRSPSGRWSDVSIYIHHLETPSAVDVFTMVTGKKWNLIPQSFEFAPNGHSIFIIAADCGRRGLYRLDLQPNAYPRTILRNGAVSAFYTMAQGKDGVGNLLVSSSTLVEPWIYQVLDGDSGQESQPWVVTAASHISKLGLSPKQVSEIYFEGEGDHCVQAWVVKPRNFDPTKKYPLCLSVHGGPMSSWDDEWDNGWNLAVCAEQGYIVVAPNITGSRGFGLEFQDRVNDSWGGRPYEDLVNCLEYVKDMPGIDMENAIAIGGSYGGYMMNWIQGHQVGRRFKALVCHSGPFHLPSLMLQTDLTSNEYFGGPPFLWKNQDGLERYNPARPDLLKNWSTPMLVSHNEKDYRIPVTEGLAAYRTLKELGTPARFLNFPDENHLVLKDENLLEWYRQVFDWINKWSGVTTKNEDTPSEDIWT